MWAILVPNSIGGGQWVQDQFISTFVSMRWLEMRLCSGDRSTHDSDFAINGDHEHAVRVEIPPVEPHFLCNSATQSRKNLLL